MKKVEICIPFFGTPFPQTLDALRESVPVLQAAGWDAKAQIEVNNPYISSARNVMLRKALDRYVDAIVFIDHDVSWSPRDLLTLIEVPNDVVAGTYRFKRDDIEYMGMAMPDLHGQQQVRWQGPCNDPRDPAFQCAILGHSAPAGFLKITPETVDRFMKAYPELVYGPAYAPSVDLFNHGVKDGVWWGEDYAFCRNWRDLGGELWLVPNLNISHWRRDANDSYTEFMGNYHWYLASCAGGAMDPERLKQENGNAEHETGRSGIQRSAA